MLFWEDEVFPFFPSIFSAVKLSGFRLICRNVSVFWTVILNLVWQWRITQQVNPSVCVIFRGIFTQCGTFFTPTVAPRYALARLTEWSYSLAVWKIEWNDSPLPTYHLRWMTVRSCLIEAPCSVSCAALLDSLRVTARSQYSTPNRPPQSIYSAKRATVIMPAVSCNTC